MTLIPLVLISAGDVAEYHGSGVPAFARLYANQQFTACDGTVVAQGSIKKPAFYQEFVASQVGDFVHLSAGDAYVTTNSNRPMATYTLVVYDEKGRVLITPYHRLRIPDENDPTTWQALEIFSGGVQMTYPPTYLSSEAILALLEEFERESAVWGDIIGDIQDQTDLIALINSEVDEQMVWGAIEGDITAQADLMALLEAHSHSAEWGAIGGNLADQTDLQTALDAKQAADADLTAIAALAPANDDFIQRKGGVWVNRTPEQVAEDLGSLEGSDLTSFAMLFSRGPASSTAQHVNHGTFWEPSYPAHGTFFWEAWVNPSDRAEYIISDDYSGAHNLLWGFTGGVGYHQIGGGNVRIDGTPVPITAIDGMYTGEWHHMAVGWDGFFIYTWVDGVISQKRAAEGLRRTGVGLTFGGILFVGGSDHSGYEGYIRSIRGFEGWCPVAANPTGANASTFHPEHNFKGTFRDPVLEGAQYAASFLADYSTPSGVIADLSSGFSNGVKQVETQIVVAPAGITGNGNAKSVVTAAGMVGSPVTVLVAVTTTLQTTATLIATALRTALRSNINVNRFFSIDGTGAEINLRPLEPHANDSTMNFTVENDTCTGITNDTTSTHTTLGYQGKLIKHPGYPANYIDGSNIGTFGVQSSFGYHTDLPTFEPVVFAKPTVYHGTPNAIPVGALVYDDYSRPNVTWTWDDAAPLTPGNARTGQSPVMPVYTGSETGIIDSCAYNTATLGAGFPPYGPAGICVYDAGTPTQDARIYKKSVSVGVGTVMMLLRYTDTDNYILIHVDGSSGSDYTYITERKAGVPTTLASLSTPGASANGIIRGTVSGTTVGVEYGLFGTPILTGVTTLLTGNKAGFAISQYSRVDVFEVY